MKKLAFVSGSDSKYYPLLREWIESVRQFPQATEADICIIDAGLTAEQIEKLKPLVTKIVAPDWPCKLPESKIKGRTFLKSCVCRPFIPQIFPGYEIYFWMDADTWVQDWRGPELFIEGGRNGKIALTGQVDRAYPRQARVKWLWRWPWKVRSFYFSNARQAFSFNVARKLLPYHVLLAGAFALRADARHWKRWQELVVQTMKKGKLFTAEQVSLGVMCYLEDYEFEILPAWTHWLCEFKPNRNAENTLFLEPYLPHNVIGILHLSGVGQNARGSRRKN